MKMYFGESMAAHIDLANYTLDQGIEALAKGSCETADSATLMSIASSLICISMIMLEEREYRRGRFAHGYKAENSVDHPEGQDVSGRKNPIQR